MGLINDGIGVLLGLAPMAALVALVLAGLVLRNQGSFFQGGKFAQWVFWAIVMLTLPQLLSWFSGYGVAVPISGGGGTAFLNALKSDITNFVNSFVVGVFAPVMSAWLVLRAVIDLAEGHSPLWSILGAMFLLSIGTTSTLLQGWNSQTKFATTDVLAGLWTYVAGRVLPVAAGLAIVGAILNFAFGKPSMRLVCAAGGFLTVSGLWQLVKAMMQAASMVFLNGITNLTNWMGNVIMPTVAGLFLALGIVRYAKGYSHSYITWAGFLCLMVSGLLRGLEHFAGQAAWNNGDVVWITLRTLVNWLCNVFMPVYAVTQIVGGVLAYGGIGHRIYQGMPWARHFAAAAMALMLSGLLRLAEFFVAKGTGGIS